MDTELIRLHYGSDGRLRRGNDAINADPVGPPRTLEWEDSMTTLEHLILLHKPSQADSYVKAEETFTYKVRSPHREPSRQMSVTAVQYFRRIPQP